MYHAATIAIGCILGKSSCMEYLLISVHGTSFGLNDNTSAIAEHAMKYSHDINWDGAKVIDKNSSLYPRCYLEPWHISSMNRYSIQPKIA
jgi:hypothetical protein